MNTRRVLGLASFAIRANLRLPMTRAGIVTFAGIALLGPLAGWRNGTGWSLDAQLLFYGYLVASLFVVRSGLEQQKETGLLLFLRHNLSSPVEHAGGAVLSLLGTWTILTGCHFLLTVVCGGSLADAAWHTLIHGLALTTLLPFVLLVEAVAEVRIPMLVPVLAYLALAVILSLTLGTARMAALIGIGVDRTHPASSLALLARATAVAVPGLALFVAGTWAKARAAPRRSTAW